MNILIADDHQLTVEGYKMILSFSEQFEDKINFIEAKSCKEAFFKINENTSNKIFFDLAIIDYSMPTFPEENIYNGADICLLLQKKMPKCKTLILTASMENIALFEMVHNINPDGVATKSDVNGDIFLEIIKLLFLGKKYRSNYVQERIEEVWQTQAFVNELNRKILYFLSKGYKLKEISSELSISEIAVKKRISKIKQSLNLNESDNLLKVAKTLGYI